ncbi:MAG: glycosyltransferase [Alphaproteobacteria bacterium]|nr:glycosyltransferase [Alphaproteobacteria bacterium]
MSLNQATVSVVTVTYFTGPALWMSIESVLAQEHLKELVIVDNGNAWETVQTLRKMSEDDPRIKLITGHGNVGFARANNMGAKEASGEYLLFLNPDCLLPPGTFAKGIAALESDPKVWVVGCRLMHPDGSEQGGARRNLLTPWIAFVEALKLYRLAPNHPSFSRMSLPAQEGEQENQTVPATSGAFMMMRKETYQRLGGMDEDYFLHVEDLDFCLQVQKAGGEILYVPSIQVVHFLSTSKVSSAFLEWNKTKGFIHYFYKHFRGMYPKGFLEVLAAAVMLRGLFRICWDAPRHFLHMGQRQNLQALRRLYLLKTHLESEIPEGSMKEIGPVLVTGATGQVGISILRLLLKGGGWVIAIRNRRRVAFEHPRLVWFDADLSRDAPDLRELAPTTVIHTASIWMLPGHLKRFHEAGVRRVITFSSTSLFGKASSRNPYEIELVRSLGRAEEECTRLCRELGIRLTILRPTLIYGTGLDGNVSSIREFIERFGVFPVYPPASGMRQPVHTEDLARAAVEIIDQPETYGKAYNLSGGEVVTYKAMVERIYSVLGLKSRILTIAWLPTLMDVYSKLTGKPDTNGEIARRMNEDLAFDHLQAFRDFGYNPRRFLEGGRKDLGDLFL